MPLRWTDHLVSPPRRMDSADFDPKERAFPFFNQHFEDDETQHIEIDDRTVTFALQRGPVREVGVNGCQIDDILTFVLGTLQTFNKKFPARENSLAITKLEEALHWLDARRRDREHRGVEGQSRR